MSREITPSDLDTVLRSLSYPVVRPDAAIELRDVTLVVEDRRLNLGALVSDTGADAYRSPDDLVDELDGLLAESDLLDVRSNDNHAV